ncbi:FliH/SctL family protein [Clostridium sp. E02]|uniref:FliH/SctL family protein n=1 Tax=Clostridium sp. E02 TaxID=2487134 RepID=UPI000F52A3A8|nr:FliH/SctL family protein [Clostridium sp. E02]
MISLPNIMKRSQITGEVLDYGLKDLEDIMTGSDCESLSGEQLLTESEESRHQQTDEVYEEALKEAQEIVSQAKEEAKRIRTDAREDGHQEGYETGFQEGKEKAFEEHKQELDRQLEAFQNSIKETIESVAEEKNHILDQYIDDLKKITLTIAEKVIQTSLRSSGEIIKRMIVTAAGKLKKTQWVKIYVSQKDAGLMIQGDVGLLKELSHISGNIKIIAMENAEDGTCIIELPEEIIDVSVNTQIENIKGILNNARL